MTTQQETITWHRYPDEKPIEEGKEYIVTYEFDAEFHVGEFLWRRHRWWIGYDGRWNESEMRVIAWAEPKGWWE